MFRINVEVYIEANTSEEAYQKLRKQMSYLSMEGPFDFDWDITEDWADNEGKPIPFEQIEKISENYES